MKISQLIIKIYDFVDYILNRFMMKLNYYISLSKREIFFHKNINRILVIRLGSLGDVVRSTIVLEMLRVKYPQAVIDLLTSDAALPVVANNPDISNIYTPGVISQLNNYDWVINLQAPDPPSNFLKGIDMGYGELLRFLTTHITYRLITGRNFNGTHEKCMTDIQYCISEVEEILLTALLSYDRNRIYLPKIILKDLRCSSTRVNHVFSGSSGKPLIGVYFGASNDIDRGTRTFSLKYLYSLIDSLGDKFDVVIIGQSNGRPLTEYKQYLKDIENYQNVIDMVDNTDLNELMFVISKMSVLVSTDSSPIHLAMGLRIPFVGLYSNSSSFRISSNRQTKYYKLFDAFEPCFKYNYRWKFFCDACMEKHSIAYHCHQKEIIDTIEHISISKVVEAINTLLIK